MSLDFVVLGQNGAPERTVSIGVKLHHELLVFASSQGLNHILNFADYYEDREIAIDELGGLAEQVLALRSQPGSTDLYSFLEGLSDLIAYAVANGKPLHAVAD